MKKILFLTISLLMITAVFAKVRAANPIPSFSVLLTDQATFQEDPSIPISSNLILEKRDMNVSNDGSPLSDGPGTPTITVYIYRLDRSVILGPYTISVGARISVPIDGNRWGVYAQTNSPTMISVWTDKNE